MSSRPLRGRAIEAGSVEGASFMFFRLANPFGIVRPAAPKLESGVGRMYLQAGDVGATVIDPQETVEPFDLIPAMQVGFSTR